MTNLSPFLPKNKGFTLVEMSIVLVIIGLIVAGITLGRNLMRNGQLKSVIKEINTIYTFVMQFKDLYEYYPGDFPNA
jgi:prepilin-type N-terminal cleavage/methylation domain-containing protein